ncbi:hypothetical protein V1503_23430 [Bacillus sp. SCS-151]|uniref:hypothetical protein n=1 Tax=Nanhaiella sioensis TaxID=3115293 RepID=UPI00397E5A17
MAWENGEWLEYDQLQHKIEEINDIITLIDAEYNLAEEMPVEIAQDYFELIEKLERYNRIHRGERDLLYFAYEYFGEDLNPENSGNWIPSYDFDVENELPWNVLTNAPSFHHEICGLMDEVSYVKRNDKVGVAAPRSHAKSSFLSKAYPIHEVVYRLRKYIIIISETPDVSSANMDWISNQLKYNEKLRANFGPLLDPKLQGNEKDNSSEFIAWHPIVGEQHRRERVALVQAASTGQRLRGRNWDGNRPDLVICDDLEDANTNASTPELRKKLREWFASVVMPLGDPKGELTAYVYMGTTVHHDALLMNILHKRSDFRTKIYRAMIEQPKNMALCCATT